MSAQASALQRVVRPGPGRAHIFDIIERRTGLTSAGTSVVLLSVIGWIIARTIGSRVMFLMVYATVLLMGALFLLGARKPAITARRSELPVRMREHQTVAVELELTAKRRLSTLVIEEQLHPSLGRSVSVLIPSLPAGEGVNYSYSFIPRLRGVYAIGPLTAVWSDPFGLTRRRMTLTAPNQVIVHPSTEMVHDRVLSREWEDPPVRPPISKPWPTGFEFYGMREYVPGDDPRRIVWRATARTGKYMVREAEQGITDRITLIIDTDRKSHSEGEPSETFEAAIRVAASLGVRHLKDGFGVSVDTPEGRVADSYRGGRLQVRLLDDMARMQLTRTPLSKALDRTLVDPHRDSHCVLISPHLDARSATILRLLIERGGSIVFVHLMTEDSDRDSLNRAAAVGCQVVELDPSAPLESAFRRGVGAGLRR